MDMTIYTRLDVLYNNKVTIVNKAYYICNKNE